VSDVSELGSSEYQPTMKDLSDQIGSLSAHIVSVQGQVVLARRETAFARQETADVRTDLTTLSKFVMGDQAERLRAVEARTPAQKVSAAACLAGKGTAYVTLIAVGARMLGKAFPQFDGAINDLLGAFGL
jgi:hypothetical protein